MGSGFVSFALIGLGIALCIQGVLTLRRRLTLRANFFERPIIALWQDKKARIPKILGQMRLMYGVFFLFVGVWSLF